MSMMGSLRRHDVREPQDQHRQLRIVRQRVPAGRPVQRGRVRLPRGGVDVHGHGFGSAARAVDLQTSATDCGTCGNRCMGGQVCNAGTCSVACGSGLARCGNNCVDLQNDKSNCGFCAQVCAGQLVCVNSNCACPTGTTDCAGVCADLTSDPSNCGGCGTSRARPGTSASIRCASSGAPHAGERAAEWRYTTSTTRWRLATSHASRRRSKSSREAGRPRMTKLGGDRVTSVREVDRGDAEEAVGEGLAQLHVEDAPEGEGLDALGRRRRPRSRRCGS